LEYYETNKARNTYLFYKMYLDQLKKVCGQKPAADITPFDVETLKRYYMKRNCTVNSINHAIRSVKTAYNWAMDFDLLNVNPIVRVKKLPNPRGRTRFLTEEEEVRLIAATKGNLRDMIVIYLRTGMRLSELTQMKWSEVDMARGVLTVFKSKTSNTVKHYKPRVIPMHPDVRKILERRRPTQGYIFQSRACKPYDKNSLRKIFDRVRKKANLPDIYIHCLRHTFASRLALRGVPLTVVAELLGHTDIQTTQMYAHLAPSDLQRAIDKLDNLPV
jgi:integrase